MDESQFGRQINGKFQTDLLKTLALWDYAGYRQQ